MTAFTSSPSKFEEAKRLGAHKVIATHDKDALAKAATSFEMILVTANAPLEWDALIGCLTPNGRLHIVGAVTEPIPVHVPQLINHGNCISASPTGSPSVMTKMLEFAGRHNIAPEVEHFPMSKINEAFDRLKSGKARYRIVLDADF